ncbi:DUF1993 family protein [Bowmanella denitrificans]|uniref:DUF1993 family protein n=1 Tax=Bowmanella denitrificans TaxID=366582 RepID=A0ABP3H4I1_9ALTE
MRCPIKSPFVRYLEQLQGILHKVPDNLFAESLAAGMLPLGVHARVASNFALRGYCPLVGKPVVTFDVDSIDRQAIERQVAQTLACLEQLPDAPVLDNEILHDDKAGFTLLSLPQPEFIYHYILPNFFFHISMVYAIGRAKGVEVGKGDFDGYHSYPQGFYFPS